MNLPLLLIGAAWLVLAVLAAFGVWEPSTGDLAFTVALLWSLYAIDMAFKYSSATPLAALRAVLPSRRSPEERADRDEVRLFAAFMQAWPQWLPSPEAAERAGLRPGEHYPALMRLTRKELVVAQDRGTRHIQHVYRLSPLLARNLPTDSDDALPPMAPGSEVGEDSEFGAGVVVCLAKFSEHLRGGGVFPEEAIEDLAWHQGLSEEERQQFRAEVERHPFGDAARRYANVLISNPTGERTDEEAISHAIHMWMYAASDHFHDLDRDAAPQPLVELADLAMAVGKGFHLDTTWTMGDVKEIRRLWKESCLAVDQMLGVRADWGDS